MRASTRSGWPTRWLPATTAPEQLLGSGVLALTIDQGAYTQRYQGIVQLDGASLEEVARVYFRQSEQIPTDVRLSVAKHADARRRRRHGALAGRRHPGAVPAGRRPSACACPTCRAATAIRAGDDDDPTDNSWQELLALLATIEPAELIDPTVGAERLLYRLFHEHGVRVFEGVHVADQCSCSRDKIRGILDGFSAEEIADSIEDGVIQVNCEFCSKAYEFDPAEFEHGRSEALGGAPSVALVARAVPECRARRREWRCRTSRHGCCASCSARP